MAVNTIDVVFRLVDQFSSRMNRITQSLAQTNQAGQQVNSTTQALQAGLTGLTAVAAYQGLKQVATAMADISSAGAQYLRIADSFQAQTTTMGEHYVEVLGTMRMAARGTADDMELMLSANKAFSLGVAQTGVEVAKLIETSTVLGRRTGLGQEQALERLMVGIGRLSPRILDDLGIAVNLTQLYRDATGKASSELDQATKIQTLLNHVLDEGALILKQYPEGLEDAASGFERLDAQWTNFKNNLGQTAPFTALTNIIGDMANGMQSASQFDLAKEGKLAAAEYDAVLDKMYEGLEIRQKQLDSIQGSRLLEAMLFHVDPMAGQFGEDLKLIEQNARLASVQLDELITKREMVNSVKTSNQEDFGSKVDKYGTQIVKSFSKLQEEKAELDAMMANGQPVSLQGQYVEALSAQLINLAFAYNEAAEEMDMEGIDIPALRDFVLQLENGVQVLDVFAKAEARAKAETEADLAIMEKMSAALDRTKNEYMELIDAKRGAAEGDKLDFLTDNRGGDAAALANRAQQALDDQLNMIERAARTHMTEEQALLAVSRAYQHYTDTLEGFSTAKEKALEDSNISALNTSGAQIMAILPQISQGLYDLQEGGAGAIRAAADVDALRNELDELIATYNKAAAFLGIELIDAASARNGALAVGQATDELGLFNSTNQLAATYAQLAGNALTQEAAALSLFENSVATAKNELMTRLGNLIGEFTPAQLADMYTEGAAEIDASLQDVYDSEDNLAKKYFESLGIKEDVIGGYEDEAEAMRNAGKEAESLADTIENKLMSAYESLNSVVSGELKDSLNELSNIGIGEKDFAEHGVRDDVPAENARRLAALMKEGVKDQPWLEEFKKEAPGIWDEYINAADPAAAAARMLQEFEKGLKPELIDFGQLKQQIKDNIETTMRLEGMGRQLTDELIAEMGEGEGDTIKKFVADALGIGFDESGFGTDSAAKLLSTLTSEDMKLKMIDAGAVNAMNWANGFSETMPEHMQPFIDLLVAYVTPAVEARINQKNNASKAK